MLKITQEVVNNIRNLIVEGVYPNMQIKSVIANLNALSTLEQIEETKKEGKKSCKK